MTCTTAFARSSGVISQYSTESTSICSGRRDPFWRLVTFSANLRPLWPTRPMIAVSLTIQLARLVARTPVGLIVVTLILPCVSTSNESEIVVTAALLAVHAGAFGPAVALDGRRA